MKSYIGIKRVKAEPMTREEACKEGLVRENECNKPNEDGYKVVYEDGYISWSPKDVFEKYYELIKESEMEKVKYYRLDKVYYGVPVNMRLFKELIAKYPNIYVPENNSENVVDSNGNIGAIMSRDEEDIDAIVNGEVCKLKGSWFSNTDTVELYKTKNDTFNFCELRNLARAGVINKFARKGWNGKGMFIVYVPGSEVEIREGSPYWKADIRGKVKIDAHFDMYTAQGTVQPGWVCSQADMNADDWVIVE